MLAARTPSRGPWTRSATIRATEMPVGHDRVVATVETAPEQTDLRALGRERWVRRAFTAALSLFLLLSLVGFILLNVESPGLLTGLAGIGYGLLRLAAPSAVPSVLLMEGMTWPTDT